MTNYQYPNHYEMKKNRLAKIEQTKCKCEICGNRGYMIHHRDGSVDNHKIDNLLLLCIDCHKVMHAIERDHKFRNSKYVRLYGDNLAAISKQLGRSQSSVISFHKRGLLQGVLLTGIIPGKRETIKSVYVAQYGMTLAKISRITGLPYGQLYKMHLKCLLKAFLDTYWSHKNRDI